MVTLQEDLHTAKQKKKFLVKQLRLQSAFFLSHYPLLFIITKQKHADV